MEVSGDRKILHVVNLVATDPTRLLSAFLSTELTGAHLWSHSSQPLTFLYPRV